MPTPSASGFAIGIGGAKGTVKKGRDYNGDPDTRTRGATLGGRWAVGDRVDAVKNNNVLKRSTPGVIKAVRRIERKVEALTFKLSAITHAYEIEYDDGAVEPGVPNTFIVGAAAVTVQPPAAAPQKIDHSPAPPANKNGDAAAPAAAVVNDNDAPSSCRCF